MANYRRSSPLIVTVAVAIFICDPGIAIPSQDAARVRLMENSDWWSGLRNIENEYSGEPQEREVPASNFQIAGVNLGEDLFGTARTKLGKTTIVERGDAASGREQACYVSLGTGKKIHLILERGEVSYSFHLFSGGKAWNGMELCGVSEQVNWKTQTASGLHLGLTQQQVIAILGKPSLRRNDQLIYSLHATKKNTEDDLRTIRKNLPNISEEELHRNYEHYDWSAGFDFKFEDSKLTFFAVFIGRDELIEKRTAASSLRGLRSE